MLNFLFAILSAQVHAQTQFPAQSSSQGEKSAFESALESDANARYSTKERWVQVGDSRYRQVEYRGKNFYMKLNQRTGEFSELECDLPTGANEHNLEAGVQVFARSKLFVQMLQETCERTSTGQRQHKIRIDPRMGFTIPDDGKSAIKNKKVYVTPLSPGLGFSGDW